MTVRLKRFATALVLAVALVAAFAPATSFAQDNTAVAINTKDDSSLFKLAFSIKQIGGEVVDQTNAAVAYANCQDCQTVAIAIQVLLVTADNPSVVMPTNLAVAVNENCDTCTTMALAYQFVIGGQDLQLTGKGRQELARIRHDLLELGKQGLSAAEIRDRTAALVQQLRDVLSTELVPRKGSDGGNDQGGNGGGQGNNGASPSDSQPAPPPSQTDTTPQDTTPQQAPPQSTTPQQAPAPQQTDGTTTTP